MEGNISAGYMIPGPMHVNHQQHPQTLHQQHNSHNLQGSMVDPPICEIFPCQLETCMNEIKGRFVLVRRARPSFNEDSIDGHNEAGRGKKGSPWQRMKWTDKMWGRRKFAILQKERKWKSVSKVMAERGCYVSPQQCEDKFNDLNKRYKRLTDVLGRGTSCKVVENPALLDMMDHLSEKAKEDVKKILSSKHLFYEEMCSYHNGNRLHLPSDPALQRSLQLALRSRDDHDSHDSRRNLQEDFNDDDDDQDGEEDHDDEADENHNLHGDQAMFGVPGCFPKRMKQGHEYEDLSFGNPSNSQDCGKRSNSHMVNSPVDMNQVFPEGSKGSWIQKQWVMSRSLQLEEQKLHLQVQTLELEKQRFKWQKFSRKKDGELDKLMMQNERMKLENERMTLELKRKELESNYN
ncbi:hypothetical protein MKW92_043691 [Papaver armeniacum]|nr:hypothetical protein MKW92_043691 [Papaver armeniacum]